MSNEPVFIAIGIACVVAILLFIVFIIYCVKKHQDKEETRLRRERRAREERHRRHLMNAHIVRPPPYDANRQTLFSYGTSQIPVSPPPEYKEVATPIPRNRNAVGIGGVAYSSATYGYPPESEVIPTISRNVAPVNTVFTGNNYFITQHSVPSYSNSNGNNNNRNSNNNNNRNSNNNNNNRNIINNNNNNNNNNNDSNNVASTNNRNSDNTVQVRPLSREASTTIVVPPSDSPVGDNRNGRSINREDTRNIGPVTYSNNMTARQRGSTISTSHVQSSDRTPAYSTTNGTSRNERSSFDSTNRNVDRGRGYISTSLQEEGSIAANRSGVNNGRRHSHNAINNGYGGSYAGTSLTSNASSAQAAQVYNPYSYYTRGQNSLQRGANPYGTNERSPAGVNDLSLI